MDKKKIYDKWKELTEVENTRRDGVVVQWDASKDAFDNATCLTMESSLGVTQKNPITNQSPGSEKNLSTKSTLKGKVDNIEISTATKVSLDESQSEQNASPTSTVIATNTPHKRIELVENAQGVLPTAECSFCQKMTSHHYCRQERKGSNKFLNGKEICGRVMCHLCIFGWPGRSEGYRGCCKSCKEMQSNDEVSSTSKSTTISKSLTQRKRTVKKQTPKSKSVNKSLPPTKKTTARKKRQASVISLPSRGRTTRTRTKR